MVMAPNMCSQLHLSDVCAIAERVKVIHFQSASLCAVCPALGVFCPS